MKPFRLLTPFAVLLAAAPLAHASAVFVQTGQSQGQGYSFKIGKMCLAVTANHVVTGAKRVELVSVGGEQAFARVLGRHPELDLALMEIPAVQGRSLPRLCSGETRLPTDVPLLLQQPGRSRLLLQRVASRAGAVDQTGAIASEASEGSPWFQIKTVDAIAQGDSGATVWLESGASRPSAESNGTLMGIALSVEGDVIRILRADVLQQAVYSMLWPVDLRKVRFGATGDTQVRMLWGPAPNPRLRRQPTSLSWSAGAATVHFTLDLGDRDTVVGGLIVTRSVLQKLAQSLLGGLVEQARATDRLRISISTSSQRPGDAGGTWGAQSCPVRDSKSLLINCEFRSPMIVRGIIVEVEGDVSSISGVSLKVGK